jgi:RHS repeat-associated protein
VDAGGGSGTGTIAFTLGQGFNADGQLSGHTWPDASASQYTYSQGQLTGITLPTHTPNAPQSISYSQYQWMQAGSIQTPGTTKTQAFDALQRPLGITVKGAANQTLLSRNYQYDPAGNITQIASELGQTQYAYDSLNRLTQASPDAALKNLGLPQEQYSYDGVYNRTSSAHQAGAWAYNQDNQLVQYPELKNSQALPTQVAYTPTGHTAGETNSQGTKTYRYNAAERLIEVSQSTTGGSTTSTTYRYDPFGRRISKTHSQGASTSTTYFVYNDTGLMAELNEQGQMTKAYGFNPQAAQAGLWSTDPLWQAEVSNNSLKDPATQTHYLHTDHLGTPVLATDKTGQATWKGISEAFGQTRVDNGSQIEMNLRFPGQYWDRETNTHYNFNRDYRPQVGRYVQSDPIGLKGGINTYVYVENRPGLYFDHDGLAVMWSGSIVGGGATGGVGGYFGVFKLISECKCNKKFTISGFVSLFTFGAGVQGPIDRIADLSGTSGNVNLEDRWTNCPDPYAATGSAMNSGVNAVFGVGASFLSVWRLGRLKSINYVDGPNWGVDIGLVFGIGSSAVTSVVEEKCDDCK